ncbi:MAG: right-handed parallel beta-helix repeat-containing protein [Verrucomicrobiota bacterium]
MKGIKIKQFELAIALGALAANALAASPIWVANTNDSGAGSLRAAITQANEAGGGEIQFSITNTITLLSSLPSLTNITLTGPGTNLLTISGGNSLTNITLTFPPINTFAISGTNQFPIFSMNPGTTNTLSGLTIANGMVSNYYLLVVYGAGISNAGSLNLLNCAILNCALEGEADNVRGAGIYNAGNLLMSYCTVADCSCFYPAADSGPGSGIANEGELIMEDCAVLRCDGASYGGGVFNAGSAWLTRCIIASCSTASSAGDGAGIYNENGSLVLQSCIVSNCNGTFSFGAGVNSGGGLAATNSTFVGNSANWGGGLFLSGTNILSGCTINGNSGDVDGGGGVANFGTLTMLNCTVSQNDAPAGGGGMVNDGTLTLSSCTIVSNYSYYAQSGGVENSGTLYSQNSIFAGNTTNDFSGVLTSQGFNLIQDTNGCTITNDQTGNIYGADPLLGPLQDNGGPTWTHALLPGSPAIDAGCSTNFPPTDQRGIHRPQGLAPDIGAFEFQYATPVLVRMAAQSRTNCGVTLCGLSGGIYTLQASTNLVNWFNVATNIADTNGVCVFTDSGMAKHSRYFYRVSLPVPAGSLYIPAPSGIVDAPFLITNTYIWQTMLTGVTNGGRAEYPFNLPKAGNYVLQAMVNAPNDGANSFYVNIDTEPQDPTNIWDVYPYTSASGFEQRTVNWRGDGTDGADQFVPKVFNLTQGSHQLVIRGRESYTLLQSINIITNQ